ncbi:MAG TPA: amino acid ABC transporter permease [Bordetella sp.]
MRFEPSIILDNAPLFLKGALLTLEISACALSIGFVLGVAIALLRLAPSRVLHGFAGGYIAVLRSVPFIIFLFLVYYGLPFSGIRIPALTTGIVSVALFSSPYYAEVIRSAIQALPAGQYESARVIGMSPAQAMRHVIAPQIVPALIAPATNVTLTMIKDSAVLSSITIPELSYQGLIVQGNTFAPFEVFAAVAGLYWLISMAIAEFSRRLELRVAGMRERRATRNALADRYLSLDKRTAA